MTFPFEWLTREHKLDAIYQTQRTILANQEQLMSDIAREASESRESILELKRVVGEVVTRLLNDRTADKATIAEQALTIAELQGVAADADAAAVELDNQQKETATFAEELKTVGIEVPAPVEPEPPVA
jgi:hypothetical protein